MTSDDQPKTAQEWNNIEVFYERRIEELTAANRQLEEDAAMLDWLAVHCYRGVPDNPPNVYAVANSEVWPLLKPSEAPLTDDQRKIAFRAAIAQARNAENAPLK